MNNIKILLLGTSLSLIPNLTFAQCVAQDCATLGYTETSCPDGTGLKCPFGNWWACITSDSECEQQFCDKYGFQYTCTGTGYSGGTGSACEGKYTACTCTSGYEWKDGSCQQQILKGAQGELYYCNGTVVGVRATGMDFYVAMKDLGYMYWNNANSQCQSYSFCGNVKGTLPTKNQLLSIFNNISRVNTLLSTNSGAKIEDAYWSSTSNDNYSHYFLRMTDGDGWYVTDNNKLYVRPVLASW